MTPAPYSQVDRKVATLKLVDVLAWQALLRELSTPAFVVDRRLVMLYANPAFLRFTELRPSDILEASSAGSFLGEDIGAFMLQCQRHRLPQMRADMGGTTPKGKELRVHMKVVPLFDGRDVVVGSLQLLIDTSVERRLHEKYRKAMTEERADRMAAEVLTQQLHGHVADLERSATLGALAGGIAHELNNPMQVISGQVELIRMNSQDLEGLPEAPRRKLLQRIADIEESIARCQRVIQRLLGFLHTGEQPELAPGSLPEAVDQAVRYLKFHPRGRTIRVRGIEDPVPAVPMARDLVVQMLLNLLVNASDAMGGTGEIVVRLREGDDPRYVELCISDTGPGIPEAVRDRIFEPFFSTKPKGHGTGIGLFLVKYIVNQHQGTISVESPPSGGATFRILLPRGGSTP